MLAEIEQKNGGWGFDAQDRTVVDLEGLEVDLFAPDVAAEPGEGGAEKHVVERRWETG